MIRRATAEDTVAIADLFERSFATLTFLPVLHTREERLAFFGGLLGTHEVWVFEGADGLLAFCTISDMLDHFYVDPAAFGTGVADALFEHVQSRRPDGFTFWVFQQNTRARRFYERHGSVVLELTDGAHNEERTPDALYEWRPADPHSGTRPEQPRQLGTRAVGLSSALRRKVSDTLRHLRRVDLAQLLAPSHIRTPHRHEVSDTSRHTLAFVRLISARCLDPQAMPSQDLSVLRVGVRPPAVSVSDLVLEVVSRRGA
jgi:ribosomal protein S18 acetylase RimI-like enzyme